MLYADLEGVKVRGTSLAEGDFRGAELSQAELADVHLRRRTCELPGLSEPIFGGRF